MKYRNVTSIVHCKPDPDLNSHLTPKRVESGLTESNMLHLGRIQVRTSKETEKYKSASCTVEPILLSWAFFTSGVRWESRSRPGLQFRLSIYSIRKPQRSGLSLKILSHRMYYTVLPVRG
jgi:hypothetical protein